MADKAGRCQDLLELEGKGFSKPEIVKHLSEKHRVSARTIYYDFETRREWQRYTDEETILTVLNRFEQLYRMACFNLMTAENEAVKVGWARVMLEANREVAEKFIIPSILERLRKHEREVKQGGIYIRT